LSVFVTGYLGGLKNGINFAGRLMFSGSDAPIAIAPLSTVRRFCIFAVLIGKVKNLSAAESRQRA